MVGFNLMVKIFFITFFIMAFFTIMIFGMLDIGKSKVKECQKVGCMHETTYYNDDGSKVIDRTNVF